VGPRVEKTWIIDDKSDCYVSSTWGRACWQDICFYEDSFGLTALSFNNYSGDTT
jgi:hypothetical protein